MEALRTADDDQIAAVAIFGQGYGLHWEALDLDLSLTGLMAGRFGSGGTEGAGRFRIGSALAALSREAGLTNADVEVLERSQTSRTPSYASATESGMGWMETGLWSSAFPVS